MDPSLKSVLETLRSSILDNPVLQELETHEMIFSKNIAKQIADLADQSVISAWRDEAEAYKAAKERNLTW